MKPTDAQYDATLMELMRDVLHHVADEEPVLLPEAERLLADQLDDLGAQMSKRRVQLVAPRSGEIIANMARAMSGGTMLMLAGAAIGGALVATRFTRRSKRSI